MYEQGMKLYIGSTQVTPGMRVTTSNGEKGTIESFSAPHKPSSTGRVYVHIHGESKYAREYFPNVIDADWKFPCQMPDCDGPLKYEADLGAPGIGQSWKCLKCGEAHWKHGSHIALFRDLNHDDITMDEGDVI